MWEVEDALEGRVFQGKSRLGGGGQMRTLRMSDRDLYQLQKLLEELAVGSDNYFRVRMAVLLAEAVRTAVAAADKEERGRESSGG